MTTTSNGSASADAGRTDPAARRARLDAAMRIAREAGAAALAYFRDRDALTVEAKGAQDWVSEADRNVETIVRDAIVAAFPDDAIVGEEHANRAGTSGWTWIVDPIDGTTLFVIGSPGWCVAIAASHDDRVQLAVTLDPIADEAFVAERGHGARVNDRSVSAADATSLGDGLVSVGHSSRMPNAPTLVALERLMEAGGMFQRTGSGALSLAYVGAGRLVGYLESHMNAWDCAGGLLLIEEAGGWVEPCDLTRLIERGGRVVAAAPGLRDAVEAIAREAYDGM